jgi:dihydrodipicolinate synthase/N-acetylneuraminate lyase
MQTLEGLFAPLATSFTDDALSLSEIRFARQIKHLIAQSIDGFVTSSDTGEFTTCSQSERKQLVEWVARDCGGKPFLVHVSSLSTSSSLDLAQHAARHGARAAVAMPPFYGSYTPDELVGFFKALSLYGNLPIVIIDPQKAITDEVHAGLRDVPSLTFAEPVSRNHAAVSCSKGITTSDEFALGEAIVSPLSLLRPHQLRDALRGDGTDLAKLIILEETLGRARVSKCGLEALGIEVGPTRLPLKSLSGSVSVALKALLATSSA